MTVDPELDVWQEQWHSQDAIPAGLRSKVERQTRRIRIAFALDALVTIVMGGWTTTWAVMSGLRSVALLAAATWIFIAAAWIFVIVNLHGAWAPHELSVAEFVAVSIRRCRARRRAVIFGGVLCVVEVVFCLEWLYWNYGAQDPVTAGAVCAGTVAFVGLCVWCYGREQKELATLMAADDKPASFRTRRRKAWRRA
jgi:hypothetical protein